MALCLRCATIDLGVVDLCRLDWRRKDSCPRDKYHPYTLWDTALMNASAENGCEGCEFFARFIPTDAELRDHFGEEAPRQLQARLSRLYDTYGVDLEFWNGTHGLISYTNLRICSTFGMWLNR